MQTDAPEHVPGCVEDADEYVGLVGKARARAIVLATAGGNDTQILAALRTEFCACRPQKLTPSRLAKSFVLWVQAGDLDDARQAGELVVLQRLQETALGDDPVQATRAAVHLDNRRTKLEGADGEVLKILRELLALPETGLVAKLEETLAALKGRQVRTG